MSPAHAAAIPSSVIFNPLPAQATLSPRNPARRRAVSACSLEFTIGDITRQSVDAIVNPAGPGLVDLAVRRGAGPDLLEAFHAALAELPEQRLAPGQAVVTPGFALPAPHVIHVAPPVYADDPASARAQLAACYVEALRVARERGFASIAFPAIATGVYRYPADEAAEVAVGAVVAALRAQGGPPVVRFVLSSPAMLRRYAGAANG